MYVAQVSNDFFSAKSAGTGFWQDQVQNGRLWTVRLQGTNVGFLRAQLEVRPFPKLWTFTCKGRGSGLFAVISLPKGQLKLLYTDGFDTI